MDCLKDPGFSAFADSFDAKLCATYKTRKVVCGLHANEGTIFEEASAGKGRGSAEAESDIPPVPWPPLVASEVDGRASEASMLPVRQRQL